MSESKLVPSGEVARILGVKTPTLARWRREGRGPSGWVYRSANRVCYPESEIRAYIESLTKERPPKEAA
jgi:predicted site-specific integrase-resolvase